MAKSRRRQTRKRRTKQSRRTFSVLVGQLALEAAFLKTGD
jgi:hypothetical protein